MRHASYLPSRLTVAVRKPKSERWQKPHNAQLKKPLHARRHRHVSASPPAIAHHCPRVLRRARNSYRSMSDIARDALLRRALHALGARVHVVVFVLHGCHASGAACFPGGIDALEGEVLGHGIGRR